MILTAVSRVSIEIDIPGSADILAGSTCTAGWRYYHVVWCSGSADCSAGSAVIDVCQSIKSFIDCSVTIIIKTITDFNAEVCNDAESLAAISNAAIKVMIASSAGVLAGSSAASGNVHVRWCMTSTTVSTTSTVIYVSSRTEFIYRAIAVVVEAIIAALNAAIGHYTTILATVKFIAIVIPTAKSACCNLTFACFAARYSV
jgi:uncharacterized membrane protein